MIEMAIALNPAVNLTTNFTNFYPTTTAAAITASTTLADINGTNFYPLAENATTTTTAATAALTTLSPFLDLMLNFSTDVYDTSMDPCDPDNPYFNCSREKYLEFAQGPSFLPFHKALMATIIFGGIFITGVLGNVLVCVVIVRHSTMHTATNYYLFSLAVSDLLYLLFGLPAEIFSYWHMYPYLFGLPFCKIRALISEASGYVSVLTIVAFSMERFLAICHPLHLYAMSGFKRAIRIIAALWVISFISALPFCMITGIGYVTYPKTNTPMGNSAFCGVLEFYENFRLFEFSFYIFFVIPMVLIIILYGRMGAQIRATTTQQLGVQQGSMHRESRHQQSRKAVIRMLAPRDAHDKFLYLSAAVVITFFVCWLPFHVQRLWIVYSKHFGSYDNFELREWIYSVSGFAYYVSCTINPILYNVMSHRYRVAFKDILCGKRRSIYYNNGFVRDQSSFRETTIASSLGGNSCYDRVHSVRVRSIRHMNNVKDRDSVKSNNVTWSKKTEFTQPLQQDIVEDPNVLSTNVVVVVDNGINGRPKVYTENEAQENLINKGDGNETCI